ncbi:MAG: 4Fe-4S dicluster domain-containing protein [Vulcanimicrobiaceae bacterium]
MNSEPSAADREAASRRAFLAKAASAVLAGIAVSGSAVEAAPVAKSANASPAPMPAPPFSVSAEANEDVLVTMQRDLVRALAKPMSERRWGMVIDTRKCVGCSSCTVGCVMENKLPPGVVYRPVIDMEVGTYPNVVRKFLPRPCMQCENPPCVPVCPVAATFKREDGIVEIDYNICIGCRYCITACPYQARTFDFGENWTDNAAAGKEGALALDEAHRYEAEPSNEYGRLWKRTEAPIPGSPAGNARKCQFCAHRLAEGMLPMCVTTCLGRATSFGDLNDPESIVSQLIARNDAIQLKEELGTHPKVYYLM